MVDRILAQMNATLQPQDKPFTIDDAQQHVDDYNTWADGKILCDCGQWHDFKFELNANTGTYTCRECLEARRKQEQREREIRDAMLEHEIEYLSNPVNMFREYLRRKGIAK